MALMKTQPIRPSPEKLSKPMPIKPKATELMRPMAKAAPKNPVPVKRSPVPVGANARSWTQPQAQRRPAMLMPPPGGGVGGMLRNAATNFPPWIDQAAAGARQLGGEVQRQYQQMIGSPVAEYFKKPTSDWFQPLVPRNEWTESGGQVGVQGSDIVKGLGVLLDLIRRTTR